MAALIILVVCSAFTAGAGFGMAIGLVMGQTKDTLHYLDKHNRHMQEKVR